MELQAGQRIIKVDDATDAFWTSSKLLGTLYTMYHNTWSAKVHSTKRDQPACIAVITSNGDGNITRFGLGADMDGAERRFLVINWQKKLKKQPHRSITPRTCEQLLERLIKGLQLDKLANQINAHYEIHRKRLPEVREIYESLKQIKGETMPEEITDAQNIEEQIIEQPWEMKNTLTTA